MDTLDVCPICEQPLDPFDDVADIVLAGVDVLSHVDCGQ
jgi:hypothetical protein